MVKSRENAATIREQYVRAIEERSPDCSGGLCDIFRTKKVAGVRGQVREPILLPTFSSEATGHCRSTPNFAVLET